jgi:hypothetical protein
MAKKLTELEKVKLQRAANLYDNQWKLIGPIEYPGRVVNTLNTAHSRIPKNWTPEENYGDLLRVESDPEGVAQEVSEILKSAPRNSGLAMPISLQRILSGQDKKIIAGKRGQTEEERIDWLKFKTTELEKANKDLRLKVGAQKELASELSDAVRAADPFPRHIYAAPQASKSPVVPALMLSDWHIGEVIQEDETEGFNKFNYQIASDRIFGIVDSFLKWVEVQRKIYNITTVSILGLGDWVSGNIHAELLATNEFPLPVQTAKAGLLFGEVLVRISSHFDVVNVSEVGADNHGRLQPKPQAKQKAANSMSYLVHTIANQYSEKQGNIVVDEAAGIKMVAEIADHKFLLEHGDTVKAYMGIPYYGMNRERGREAMKRMGTLQEFNYMGLGHWHVPGFVEGCVIVNGSLSGTSEFDHSVGRHAEPAQVAFMVHPKYGVFNWTPFNTDR